MIDVHCHVIETLKTMHNVQKLKTKTLFLMSTRKSEWPLILRYDGHVKAFGIHPWFAHQHTNEDLRSLEKYLIESPEAIVGEIGIDKVATDPETRALYPFDHQIWIFERQMEIASRLQRPVSIHCVHSFGYLLQYFIKIDKGVRRNIKLALNDSICPPSIMLHSFMGSIEIAKQLLKLPTIGNRFYFSLSHLVNSRSIKSGVMIATLPDDRILIESDVHCCNDVDFAMERILDLVSSSKGWLAEYTITQTVINSNRFLHFNLVK